MLTYFVFHEHLAAAQKITTTNDISCISLEWLNNALFAKEIVVGLVLGLLTLAMLLANQNMDVYLSVHLEPCNRCTFRRLPFPICQVCSQVTVV